MLDPSETDVPEAIRELTDAAGADVTFECAGLGLGRGVDEARRHLRRRLDLGPPATFDVNSLLFSEIHLVGSLAYANRHAETIRLIRDGVVDMNPFITGRIGLEQIVDQGFQELIDHKETNVKILVSP